jgi:hypothetical protein
MIALDGTPTLLKAHITFDGDRIIIDRSEFPLAQYPALDNPTLLEQVAATMRKDI